MQARGFMGLTCPAGGGRNTLPIMGAIGPAEDLGNRLPETGKVFPPSRARWPSAAVWPDAGLGLRSLWKWLLAPDSPRLVDPSNANLP